MVITAIYEIGRGIISAVNIQHSFKLYLNCFWEMASMALWHTVIIISVYHTLLIKAMYDSKRHCVIIISQIII